ncbi:MAG: hypothetical protein A2X94_07940 [Bdellovibrionales bacterium GWB1_55_8]|nr:MAG: hypothetical protein A2X94_07940 [Bdellovibrionales bacterium GWB1_55_8]
MKKTILLWRTLSSPKQQSSIARSVRPSFPLKTLQAVLAKLPDLDVQLFDSRSGLFLQDDLRVSLQTRHPSIIVIEAASYGLPEVRDLCSRIRTPGETAVFLVGQGPTSLPDEFLSALSDLPLVFVVAGEPEEIISKAIAEYVASGTFELIRSNSYNRSSRRPFRHLFQEFSASPAIVYSAEELSSYVYRFPLRSDRKLVWGHAMATRGCPHTCTFCTHMIRESYGHEVRTKSLVTLRAELRQMKDLGVNALAFADDDLTASRDYLVGLCDMMIQEGFGFRWTAHARVDECDEGLLRKMKASGCSLLRFGVEAGSERVLRYYNKTCDAANWWRQARDVVRECRKLDIQTSGLFILGAPGEGFTELLKTAYRALFTGFDLLQLHYYTPYSDTPEARRTGAQRIINHDHYTLDACNYSGVSSFALKGIYFLTYFMFYLNPVQICRTVWNYHGFVLFNFSHFMALKLGFLGIPISLVSLRKKP